MTLLTHALAAALAASCVAVPFAVRAQVFPSRPIKVVSMFVAGAGGDVLGRFVTDQMSESLGQPVVTENRGGASGVLAADAVMRSAPDGYTLLMASTGTMVVRPVLVRNAGFDTLRDFTPITPIADIPSAIFAHPSFAANSLHDLLRLAKAHPGTLSFGTFGVGSQAHLAAESIQQLAGVALSHVPYKSGSQVVLDILSGQIPLGIFIITPALQHVRAGKLKALAVLGRPTGSLPGVAPVSEALPGFEPPPSMLGLFGPANLPETVLRRLHAEAVKAMNLPEVRGKVARNGAEVLLLTPEEYAALIRRGTELVGRIAKAAGIQQLTD